MHVCARENDVRCYVYDYYFFEQMFDNMQAC